MAARRLLDRELAARELHLHRVERLADALGQIARARGRRSRRAPWRARSCSRARARCPARRTRAGACAPRSSTPRMLRAEARVVARDEVVDEQAMSSRRSRSGGIANRQDVDAVEEVLAEAAGLHLGREVAVRRGDDAHVDLDVLACRRAAGSSPPAARAGASPAGRAAARRSRRGRACRRRPPRRARGGRSSRR